MKKKNGPPDTSPPNSTDTGDKMDEQDSSVLNKPVEVPFENFNTSDPGFAKSCKKTLGEIARILQSEDLHHLSEELIAMKRNIDEIRDTFNGYQKNAKSDDSVLISLIERLTKLDSRTEKSSYYEKTVDEM